MTFVQQRARGLFRVTNLRYLCNKILKRKLCFPSLFWRCKVHHLHTTNSPNQLFRVTAEFTPYICFKNSWENLVWDQSIPPLVINLVPAILITFTLDLLMLLGENWCWSLLGPKGLSTALNVDWHLHHKLFSNILFFCNILMMASSGDCMAKNLLRQCSNVSFAQ